MKVLFWGVRGSFPTPLSDFQLKSKISAVLQRVKPCDLESETTREKFLASLPSSLFGYVGGNTPCVELKDDLLNKKNEYILFDAGSGIVEFGRSLNFRLNPSGNVFHIFISHFHWDHIHGLPFFTPGYNSGNVIHFYSTRKEMKEILEGQMEEPYFPVSMSGDRGFSPKTYFHVLSKDQDVVLGNLKITNKEVHHPGGCTAYKVDDGSSSFIYSTDTELIGENFSNTEENSRFYRGVDTILLDAQYTEPEAREKVNWGHSSFSSAVDFTLNWGIKKLILFHHEPMYSDSKLYGILQSARWYLETENKNLQVILAVENAEVDI